MASFALLAAMRLYLPQVAAGASNDTLLQSCLDRATDIVRNALRDCLRDATFDYVAYGAASTKIVLGHAGEYLTIPAHQAGSVTLVEYQTTWNPAAYATIADQFIEEGGRLYRPIGWLGGISYDHPRFRVTAVWGYGATVPDAIIELTLELATNIWRQKDQGLFQATIGATGGASLAYVGGLNNNQKMILHDVASQLWQPAI